MNDKLNFICLNDRNQKSVEVSADISADKIEALKKMGFAKLVYIMDTIETATGSMAIEPKIIPSSMECGHCGGTLHHVSIEDGYSCENEECILHFTELAYGEC